MIDLHVRDAGPGDIPAIAAVATATTGQAEWSGSDPAYVRHLLSHGRVAVAEHRGAVAGFGAIRRIGAGSWDGESVTMLCDLFVRPDAHGLGVGRALLAALWREDARRMTFSSTHPHALPLYTREGLDAWWPLLHLTGDVRALRRPPGWEVVTSDPERVAALEARWAGRDRTADHRAWAGRPNGSTVLALCGGEALAAGTVGGDAAQYGIAHLALSGGADLTAARDAVIAVLASLEPPRGTARVCLPAPHPATRALLAAGWRAVDMDVFMATDPGLLDARRAVPCPALA